jgi:CheY-like chemotaxis protein
MKEELKYIMLIDDDEDDNYFHAKAIKKNNPENVVIIQNSGIKALEYLKSGTEMAPRPSLIFLDINMPRMNGWEFLNAYNLLTREKQSEAIIIMLTTSQNLADRARANSWSFVFDYISKPLTELMMDDIIKKYFAAEGRMKRLPLIQ